MDLSKPAIVLAAILGIIVFANMGPQTRFATDGVDPQWDAAVTGRDTTKPTVVFFTATWCPYCQELANTVLTRDEVQSYLSHHYNMYTVEITTPAGNYRARKFGVNEFPTLIRYDVSGHEKSRMHNATEDDVIAWLKAGE